MNRRFITLEQLKSVASALLAKINQKPDSNSLSDVSFTGDYNDLSNRPDFSNFVNQSDFQDAASDIDSNYMMIGRDYVTAGQNSGTTLGDRATAEGYNTTASGSNSHAEGYGTTASGSYSHSEGCFTTSPGSSSHAEGYGTTASGSYSHSEGRYTIAQRKSQHVFGEYNVLDTTGTATTRGQYVEIVGNGTSGNARSNARTLDWSGNEILAGKLTVGAGPTNNMDVTTKQYVDTAIGNAASITMIDHSTSTTTELHNLTINKLSQAQYNAISTPDPNQLYMITDDTIYATQTYVDTAISNIDALPSQTGNSGKFLTTNGTTASWATINLTSLNASNLTSGTVSWDRLPTSRIYDATASRTANTVLAAPNGSAGAASFRALVAADIPNLDAGKITSGTLPIARGGTGLTASPSMLTNLGSTTAANVLAASPRPGVTGTLPVGNGGTGQTTARNAANAFMNALETGSSTPVDADYYISQYVNGGTTTTTYHRRPMSALWTYIKGKADSTYAAASHNHEVQNLTNFSSRVYDATASRTANTVLAAPNGSAGAATFRKLVEADLPTISASKISGTVSRATSATSATNATNSTNATNIYSSASTAKAYVLGTTTASSANHATVYNANVYTSGSVLYGAAWNDYAEYRQLREDQEIPYGRIVIENGDDTLSLSTERLQPGGHVVSDTFGFAIGETDKCKLPIAVSGRALVYTYEDRNTYKPGDAVCAGPEGTVSKMSREEIKEYPERIIGTVSAVPDYENWGTGNVAVDGRIWIYIK